jgi:hypothetical protein
MSEYQSNSNRMKEERKQDLPQRRAEKVISGTATQRKKNGLDKLGSIFIANDVKDVKNYILQDVLIPTIKRAFFDIICNGTGMLLGERNPQRGGGPANKVSYRSYYDNRDDRRTTASSNNGSRAKSNYSYNDLVFNNRGDAEVVLERMYELLDHFDAVSVADLFDLAGESCNYTDNKYGWTNLDDARVQSVREGYIIQLPRATTL